jgi:hypothetical protein
MKTRFTHEEISKLLGPAVLRLPNEPVNISHIGPAVPCLLVHVTVQDHKVSCGKDRWLIEPIAGAGHRWVETASLIWGHLSAEDYASGNTAAREGGLNKLSKTIASTFNAGAERVEGYHNV